MIDLVLTFSYLCSAYGDKYVLDSHDYWTVQIIEDNPLLPSKNENITWKALGQKFRLMHVRGCVLVSRNVFHPPENQQEVSCMAGAASHVFTWTVESAYHEKCKASSLQSLKKNC